MFLEVEEGGQDRDGKSSKSLFNQIHSCAFFLYLILDKVSIVPEKP